MVTRSPSRNVQNMRWNPSLDLKLIEIPNIDIMTVEWIECFGRSSTACLHCNNSSLDACSIASLWLCAPNPEVVTRSLSRKVQNMLWNPTLGLTLIELPNIDIMTLEWIECFGRSSTACLHCNNSSLDACSIASLWLCAPNPEVVTRSLSRTIQNMLWNPTLGLTLIELPNINIMALELVECFGRSSTACLHCNNSALDDC